MTVENFSECCPNHSTFNKRNATFFKVKYFSIKLVVRHCVFELQFCCYITWTFKLFLAHYCVFNPRNLTKNIKEYIYRIEETTGSRWRSDLRWNRRVKCRTAAILKSSNPGISTQSYTITNRPGVLTIWQKMSVSQRFGHPRVLGIPIPISLAFHRGCPKHWSLRLCLNYFRLGKSRDC